VGGGYRGGGEVGGEVWGVGKRGEGGVRLKRQYE